MSWFSKTPEKSDVQLLKEKSDNITFVFRQTAEDLKAVNKEIDEARKQKLELIEQLKEEAAQLYFTGTKNLSIIEKIENILE
jgi:vacuolar-type H+-ATPase subunit D/Vma8